MSETFLPFILPPRGFPNMSLLFLPSILHSKSLSVTFLNIFSPSFSLHGSFPKHCWNFPPCLPPAQELVRNFRLKFRVQGLGLRAETFRQFLKCCRNFPTFPKPFRHFSETFQTRVESFWSFLKLLWNILQPSGYVSETLPKHLSSFSEIFGNCPKCAKA